MIIEFLTYIYLLIKPFYTFSSGGMQIGDFILVIAFFLYVLSTAHDKTKLKMVLKENKHYVLFLLCVILINGFYFLIYGHKTFLIYTLYYIFNCFVILLFSKLTENEKYVNNINKIFKLNLFIQLLIFLVGIGKWYDGYRYMGTFNDPNQFAYFVFITYCLIYLLNYKKQKNILLYLIITVFLIIQSVSTGMLLGIGIFIILELIELFKKIPSLLKNNINKVLSIVFVLSVLIIILFTINPATRENILEKVNLDKITERIEEKYEKVDSENGNLIQERGYDRISYYPQYILFGAGEGYFERWSLAYHQGELHATFPNILFCYGIIPLILLLTWIYKKLKNLPFKYLIIYIALFIESFTLLNSRQSLFWIIIILGERIYNSIQKKKIEK